jgi:hypothetical protein
MIGHLVSKAPQINTVANEAERRDTQLLLELGREHVEEQKAREASERHEREAHDEMEAQVKGKRRTRSLSMRFGRTWRGNTRRG